MKTILFIVSLIFGPDLQEVHQADIWSTDKGTEEACIAEVIRLERNGSSAGRVGNLPGYRYVHAAWCEDRDEPWAGSSVQPGPYFPKDKDERDRWTPLWTPWEGHKP